MRTPHVDDRVRLTMGVPNTPLTAGQMGVVCSCWSQSATRPLYEIEFADQDDVQRRLLTREQFAIDGEEQDDARDLAMSHEMAE